MTEDISWYCLQTKPKNERLTSQALRAEIGLEVFCPFIRFERARRSGKLWVTEAMFPGYVFAKFPYSEKHRQVRSMRGVIKIVNFGAMPAPVPEEIVQELRNSVQSEETIVVESGIEPGEEVNLIDGPFRGIRAIVTKILPARDRVAVLLEVLGMEREVEVSTKAVLPDIPHPLSRSRK